VTAAELQALLDGAGDVCVLPGGVVDLPAQTRLVVPRGMRIDGNGTTLRVAGGEVPRHHLIDASRLPDGSVLEVHDLRIEGPDTTGWDPATDVPVGAIAWVWYRTWASRMVVRDVTVTGGYGTGVLRSGGGSLEVERCDLSGWVDAIACFEDHGGSGSLTVRDSVLRAPAHSKYSSIGIYVHPHLEVDLQRVTGTGWNRYLCYLNGSMASRGVHRLDRVHAVDCSLIQTGAGSTTVLTGCSESGDPANGGSCLRGPVLSSGSRWEGAGTLGLVPGDRSTRRFLGDVVRPGRSWLSCSPGTTGTFELVDCSIELTGQGSLCYVVSASTVDATLTSCRIDAPPSHRAMSVLGGVVRLVDTPRPATVRVQAPGRLEG
jgi:hypothetical protein